MTNTDVSLAELRDQGVVPHPHEAVAIAQALIHGADAFHLGAPYGPPSLVSVTLRHDGTVRRTQSAVTPAVFEIAILLNEMLPPGTSRVPGDLRYAISRGLLEIDAPPFDSIDEFSQLIARFERGDRDVVVRSLLERAGLTRAATSVPPLPETTAAANEGDDGAAAEGILGRPTILRLEPKAALPSDRRRPVVRVDELRRQLREDDIDAFEQRAIAPAPVARPSLSWRPPAVAAAVAATISFIAGYELCRPSAGITPPAQPAVSAASAVTDSRPEATAANARAASAAPAPSAVARAESSARWRDLAGARVRSDASEGGRVAAVARTSHTAGTVKAEAPTMRAAAFETGSLVPGLDRERRPIFSPAFASNGSAMFFHTGRSHDARSALKTASFGGGDNGELHVVTILDDGARNYHVQPSPDGRRIAFDSDRDGDRGVYVADSDGANVRRISGKGYAAVPTWAPDGERLAFIRAEPENAKVWNLWLLALDTGETRRVTHYSYGQTWSASWFPDNRRICYTHEDKVVVFDLDGGRPRSFESPVKGRLVRTPAVSPDGTKVIFQVFGDGAWLLDVGAGSMWRVLIDPTIEEFAWAPDGKRVAFHSRGNGQWGIYVANQ